MDGEEKNNQSKANTPPSGDTKKAQKYIDKLVDLIDAEKIIALQTDLAQFDPNSFQDHYRIDLKDYRIEISHSKLPNSGEDVYIMVFTNLQKIRDEKATGEDCTNKIILAYTKLTPQQFHQFKTSAQKQIEMIKKREEEKKFDEALNPLDKLLDNPEFEEKKDDVSLSSKDLDSAIPQAAQI